MENSGDWGGLAIAALAGFAIAMSFSKMTASLATTPITKGRIVLADEIVAKRFVVVDGLKKPRADFGFFGDSPRLALYDEKGASIQLNFAGGPLPRIPDLSGSTPPYVRTQGAVPVLYVGENDRSGQLQAGSLRIYSKDNNADLSGGELYLSSEPGYSAALRTGKSGAHLSLSDDRNFHASYKQSMKSRKPDFERLFNAPGGAGVDAGVGKDDSVQFWLTDKRGKIRAALMTDSAGLPSFIVNDEAEHSRAVLGNVGLENTKTGSSENSGPSSLVLFGKDGRVIWRAP